MGRDTPSSPDRHRIQLTFTIHPMYPLQMPRAFLGFASKNSWAAKHLLIKKLLQEGHCGSVSTVGTAFVCCSFCIMLSWWLLKFIKSDLYLWA